MNHTLWRIPAAATLLVLVAGPPARPGTAEEDLVVVKKAMAEKVAEPDREPARRPPARAQARRAEPRWLKARIVEKGRKRVTVNLPLALVRALGEDWELDRGGRARARLTLGEVLRALDSGQDLVEVRDESEGTTVRVWVE
jgi:hypothetical protein